MEQNYPGRCASLLESHTWFADDVTPLDGKWRFLRPEGQEPEGWLENEFDDRRWGRTVLPEEGCCEGTGLYRKGFQLSRDQGSRRVILRITALPRELQLWINGQLQGSAAAIHGDGEFDITDSLQPERNQICIRCEGSMTGQVGLYVLPQRAITDVQADYRTTGQGSGCLALQVRCINAEGFTVRMALMNGQDIVCYGEGTVQEGRCEALLDGKDLRFWNPEEPKLYRLALILWDGLAIHHTREKIIGIRSDTLQPGPIPVLLYQPHPDDAVGEAELQAIRDHNFTGILLTCRASEQLLSACDRIGLYVLEQTGISRENGSAQALTRLAAPRACHPCLIGWDLEPCRSIFLRVDPAWAVHSGLPEEMGEGIVIAGAWRDTAFGGKSVAGFQRADGTISPALGEIKARLAPVVCDFADGVLTVKNRSRFLSTRSYDGSLVLYRDGVEVLRREIGTDVLPGGTATIPVETKYDIYKPGRYHLSAEFRRNADGVLLARNQWEVGNLRHIYDENPGGTIREEAGRLLLRSQDSGYTLDRASGCMEQITDLGQELLEGALVPLFAAAGSGLRLPDEWERFTGRRKRPKPAILEVDQMTRRVSASFRLGSGLMQTYRLFADGSIALELRLRTGKSAPDRMGWKCKLDSRLDQFRWFGLGPDSPGEGCFFGIHQGLPGDDGIREPVYALQCSDGAGHGLRIRSEEGFAFSLQDRELTLLMSGVSEWKPHTTYTFHLTICPAE